MHLLSGVMLVPPKSPIHGAVVISIVGFLSRRLEGGMRIASVRGLVANPFMKVVFGGKPTRKLWDILGGPTPRHTCTNQSLQNLRLRARKVVKTQVGV